MEQSDEARVNPIQDQRLFMQLLRRVVFDTAPYTGALSVVFPEESDPRHPDRPLRLQSKGARLPAGLTSQHTTLDSPEARDRLVYIVARLCADMLDCEKDMVVTIHDVVGSAPLAAIVGSARVTVEFGGD